MQRLLLAVPATPKWSGNAHSLGDFERIGKIEIKRGGNRDGTRLNLKWLFSKPGREASAAEKYSTNVRESLSCIFTRIASEIFDA